MIAFYVIHLCGSSLTSHGSYKTFCHWKEQVSYTGEQQASFYYESNTYSEGFTFSTAGNYFLNEDLGSNLC